uniref:Uncharacterized protein n=1 Tax=Timema poppense TaxID=170557 RepID=A0A7R9DR58_TIMPO|nr:unnamed protein product [Timema poppensis]
MKKTEIYKLSRDQLLSELESREVPVPPNVTVACTSISIIGYVHYKQTLDREKLHEGVLRDVERQQRRKKENLYILQQQIDLTRRLNEETSSKIDT